MDSSSDKSDLLTRLLRLKRHEQPPPRYFNDFSNQVISRIERGEARVSWWERLGFDLRPAMAAAAGALACGLIIYGVATAGGGETNLDSVSSLSGVAMNGLGGNVDAPAANSTNPVTSYGTPIDRKLFRGQAVPVSAVFDRP
jgi:hypothetical protein